MKKVKDSLINAFLPAFLQNLMPHMRKGLYRDILKACLSQNLKGGLSSFLTACAGIVFSRDQQDRQINADLYITAGIRDVPDQLKQSFIAAQGELLAAQRTFLIVSDIFFIVGQPVEGRLRIFDGL